MSLKMYKKEDSERRYNRKIKKLEETKKKDNDTDRDSSSDSSNKSSKEVFKVPNQIKHKKNDAERRYDRKIKKLEESKKKDNEMIQDMEKQIDELKAIIQNNNLPTNTDENPHSGFNSHKRGTSHTGESIEGRSTEDGEFIISNQTMTWIKEIKAKEAGTPNLQYEHSYAGDRHPFGLPDFLESSWHPQPCMLNLRFLHAGE